MAANKVSPPPNDDLFSKWLRHAFSLPTVIRRVGKVAETLAFTPHETSILGSIFAGVFSLIWRIDPTAAPSLTIEWTLVFDPVADVRSKWR